MLAEDSPLDGPRLSLVDKAYHLSSHVDLIEDLPLSRYAYRTRGTRNSSGVPHLRGCEEPTPPRVEQIFAEIVVDVQGPVDLRASFLTRVRLPQRG